MFSKEALHIYDTDSKKRMNFTYPYEIEHSSQKTISSDPMKRSNRNQQVVYN
jgi:hypothetical protein